MKILLWVWFAISASFAFLIAVGADSAIHEILATLFAVQATIVFCAIYIGDKITTKNKKD